LPLVLTKLSYLIDNPWSVSMARADMAGLILADSLIDRNLGVRPVTLVGFSLGSRVIYACLRELANRGAYGIVQNVYVFVVLWCSRKMSTSKRSQSWLGDSSTAMPRMIGFWATCSVRLQEVSCKSLDSLQLIYQVLRITT